MGKAKLDRSGGCQAARLSSIKKENGGCSTREMGEGQAEKSDLVFNCFLSETEVMSWMTQRKLQKGGRRLTLFRDVCIEKEPAVTSVMDRRAADWQIAEDATSAVLPYWRDTNVQSG
jgi:hypothetical protein